MEKVIWESLDNLNDEEFREKIKLFSRYTFYEMMNSEKNRLRTFRGVWPKEDIVSGVEFAKLGFFYFGINDIVECVHCLGLIGDWERFYRPDIIHRLYYPACPLSVTRTEMIDLKIKMENMFSLVKSSSVFIYRSYTLLLGQYSDRIKTFKNFKCHVSAEELCEAGFYYIGRGKDDSVSCFYCDVIINGWKKGDNVWEEHSLCSPKCFYVQKKKGENFIRRINLFRLEKIIKELKSHGFNVRLNIDIASQLEEEDINYVEFEKLSLTKLNELEKRFKCRICKLKKPNCVHLPCQCLTICEECDRNNVFVNCLICNTTINGTFSFY